MSFLNKNLGKEQKLQIFQEQKRQEEIKFKRIQNHHYFNYEKQKFKLKNNSYILEKIQEKINNKKNILPIRQIMNNTNLYYVQNLVIKQKKLQFKSIQELESKIQEKPVTNFNNINQNNDQQFQKHINQNNTSYSQNYQNQMNKSNLNFKKQERQKILSAKKEELNQKFIKLENYNKKFNITTSPDGFYSLRNKKKIIEFQKQQNIENELPQQDIYDNKNTDYKKWIKSQYKKKTYKPNFHIKKIDIIQQNSFESSYLKPFKYINDGSVDTLN